MRTDISISAAKFAARVRAEYARGRRRFLSRPMAVRWSIGIAAGFAVLALLYVAALAPVAATSFVVVRPSTRFSADDLMTITRAFDAKRLTYRVDTRQHLIEVASEQLSEALETVGKLDVGPKPLPEIVKENEANLWDPVGVAEQKQVNARAALLESWIRPLDSAIVSARVLLHGGNKGRGGLRPASVSSAFVRLETQDDEELSSATIQSIQVLIAGAEPEIKPDSVTVVDRTGRRYLDALNPALGVLTRNRAIQEELRREILAKLDWLRGSQVSVQIVPGPEIPPPTPLPPLPIPPASAERGLADAPAGPGRETAEGPTVGVNQPLELPQSQPAPSLLVPSEPLILTPTPTAPPELAHEPSPEPVPPKVRVWVKVPRSHYLRVLPERERSLEELQAMVERNRGLIETAVRHVVPPGQLEEPVAVSTIPDESPAAPLVASAEPRRAGNWGLATGMAIGASAAGLVAGAWFLAGRRPSPRPIGLAREDRGRYKIDEASDGAAGPGPSERVRELIRLNPESAACVLQRWTGQGEPTS